MFMTMRLSENETRIWLKHIETFYREFGWLSDCFVLNFHVDSHWEKLKPSWRDFLSTIEPKELSSYLLTGKTTQLWPLSLLAFRKSISTITLDRKQQRRDIKLVDRNFGKLFKKHVKTKKRHEVEILGEVITRCAQESQTNEIIDIGSGLGHLSRYLAYAQQFHVTCVDSVETFTQSAERLDAELSKDLGCSRTPTHINLHLSLNNDPIKLYSNFGLIGLHTCGDLGPVTLNAYVNSPCASFLVSVGCCYMKMSRDGYPLSRFIKESLQHLNFTYEALEVSCHAIENYAQKLHSPSEYQKQKIHCYRATLEYLIINKYPSLRRSGLKGVHNFEEKGFANYAREAVSKLGMTFSDAELENDETKYQISEWWKVVVFYSLRLLMGTVIESGVLLDRLLFLTENGKQHNVYPSLNEDESITDAYM